MKAKPRVVLVVLLMIYIGGYYALFDENAVSFYGSKGRPAAAYKWSCPWFPTSAIYRPMDNVDYFLRPARHKHLADGLSHFVQSGQLRENWWEERW